MPTATAELTRHGDLLLSFGGTLRPSALPRTALAPVAVSLRGPVRSADSRPLPRLRRIAIAINRHGRLSPRAVPLCQPQQIEHAGPAAALAACRAALLGRGRYRARLALPNQRPVASRGPILAFNARLRSGPAILAHLHSADPAPASYLLTLRIHRRRSGHFATILVADLSRQLGRRVYATDFALTLGRSGQAGRSYLSASCPAPAGFPGATFTLARATFTFSDTRRLIQTLTRTCRVRA